MAYMHIMIMCAYTKTHWMCKKYARHVHDKTHVEDFVNIILHLCINVRVCVWLKNLNMDAPCTFCAQFNYYRFWLHIWYICSIAIHEFWQHFFTDPISYYYISILLNLISIMEYFCMKAIFLPFPIQSA